MNDMKGALKNVGFTPASSKNNQKGEHKEAGREKAKKSVPRIEDIEGYCTCKFFTITDGKREDDINFIVTYAKAVAERLSDRNKYLIDDKENNSTQIRRYFELVRNIETMLSLGRISFNEGKVELNRLRSQAEYGKNAGKVSSCFVDFININLDRVEDKRDLLFFAKHFEAVIGYLKKDKGGNRR